MHLNLEAAREAADRLDRRWRDGRPLSLIDGMPVGIKDIIETIDMPTEKGSPLFKGWRSGRDAASVAALREAGAVIVGKTVTTEFAATDPRGTRNPLGSSPHAGRIEQRLGRRRRRRHDPRRRSARKWSARSSGRRAIAAVSASSRASARSIAAAATTASAKAATGVLAATLEDAWNFCWAIASAPAAIRVIPARRAGERAGGAKPPRARVLKRPAGRSRPPARRQAIAERGRRAQARRRRDPHPRTTIRGCRGRERDHAARALLDAHQCVGVALAAQHLSRRATPSKLSHIDAGPLARPRHDARGLSRATRASATQIRARLCPLASACDAVITCRRPARRPSGCNRPAIPFCRCRLVCSAFRRSRCPCSATRDCRLAFS